MSGERGSICVDFPVQPYIYRTWELAKEFTNIQVIEVYNDLKTTGKTSVEDLNKLVTLYQIVTDQHPMLNMSIKRLIIEDDELFKTDIGFQDKKMDNELDDAIESLWEPTE